MTELVKRSAAWMARAIRDREISAVELLDAHTARIVERDPQINVLVLPRLGGGAGGGARSGRGARA